MTGPDERKGGAERREPLGHDESDLGNVAPDSVQREGASGSLEGREDEGWSQPESSAQKLPHRQDDQDDVE